MAGGGIEIADFREAVKGFKAFGVEFHSFLSGGTRPTGFLLSRLLALMVPDYRVHCYISALEEPSESDAIKLVEAAKLHSLNLGAHASWLIIVASRADRKLINAVEGIEERGMGVILVDCSEMKAYASRGFLATRLLKSLRLKRVFKRAGKSRRVEIGRLYSRVYVPALAVNSLISAFLMGSVLTAAALLIGLVEGMWVLLAVLLLSCLAGGAFYFLAQHSSILMTEDGFSIRIGRRRLSGGWSSCRRASVVRFDGSLYVRLYAGELIDIPAYMVGVDAFALRDLAVSLIKGRQRHHVEEQAGG